jgi:hypothetical protein
MSTLSNTLQSSNSNISTLSKGSKSTTSNNSKYIFTLEDDPDKEGVSFHQIKKNHGKFLKALRSTPNCNSFFKLAEMQVRGKRNFNFNFNLNLEKYLTPDQKSLRTLTIMTDSNNSSESVSTIPNILFVTPKDKSSKKYLMLKSSSLKTKSRVEVSLLSDRSKTTVRKAEEFLECLSPEHEVTNTLGCYLVTDQTLDGNFLPNSRDNFYFSNAPCEIIVKWSKETQVCKGEDFIITNNQNLNWEEKTNFDSKQTGKTLLKNNILIRIKNFSFKFFFINLILFILMAYLYSLFKLKSFINSVKCLSNPLENYFINTKRNQLITYEPSKEIQVIYNSAYEIIFHKNLKELKLLEN